MFTALLLGPSSFTLACIACSHCLADCLNMLDCQCCQSSMHGAEWLQSTWYAGVSLCSFLPLASVLSAFFAQSQRLLHCLPAALRLLQCHQYVETGAGALCIGTSPMSNVQRLACLGLGKCRVPSQVMCAAERPLLNYMLLRPAGSRSTWPSCAPRRWCRGRLSRSMLSASYPPRQALPACQGSCCLKRAGCVVLRAQSWAAS